ncbi:hypothetical protein V1Y59_03715 [Gordonia sp. PKS22-38]|uniref:DUF2946 domain-containing protein n=1 Tax=Gordonia prachuapensis TaxID=3115651 RepID=A0ABU7MPC7_9ACTN|nr:hypothetical protein [Gordonia sp. PKS22-38]
MSTVRRSSRPRRWGTTRTGLLLGIAFAILLMHSVVALADHRDHGETAAAHGPTVVHAAQHEPAPVMDDAGECDTHTHPCVFLRHDDPVVPAVAVLVLAWGFPLPPLLRSIHTRRHGRSGRPPPWAMPTHLRLQVIRC